MTDLVQDVERQRIRVAEFYALPDDDERRELIDGEVIIMHSPVPQHQDVVFESASFIKALKTGGKVYIAPLEVYFDDQNIPQPDVIYLAPESRCKVTPKRLEGPPELIVEVLSPGTARTDRVKKFRLYEHFAVREYWLIEPSEGVIEVFSHDETRFVRLGGFEAGETFVSPVLGGAQVAVNALLGVE